MRLRLARSRVAALPRQSRRSGAGGPDRGLRRPHPRERRRRGAGDLPERMDRGRNWDMSGYLNRVQLIGNLGRDPEVRTTQTGKTVVTLVIATSESWKDERGNSVERTEWHRIVILREGLAQIAEKYLVKCSMYYLDVKTLPP